MCNKRGFSYAELSDRLRVNTGSTRVGDATMGEIFGSSPNGLGTDLIVSMGNSAPRANAPANAPQPVLVERLEVRSFSD